MRKKVTQITDPYLKNALQRRFLQQIDLDSFNQLTQGQYSHNSALNMVNDWNRFSAFLAEKGLSSLPAPVTAVRQFVEKLKQKKRYASIKRSVSTIGVVHKFLCISDPTAHQQVQLILRTMRVEGKSQPNSAAHLTAEHLHELERLWDMQQVKTIRDLAIMNLMFECALKRSHLCSLEIGSVQPSLVEDGSYAVTYDQVTYQLSTRCSALLARWLEVVPFEEQSPLFRRIDRHGNVGYGALDVSSIYRIFRSASNSLGLSVHLSGQSPRAGAAKELAEQGYKLKEIQEFGRWLSPAMPALYIGNQHVADNERLKFKSVKPWTK